MTERPILMSAAMVQALLAGTKTQTRRVIKGQEYWGASITGVRNLDGSLWRLEGAERIDEKRHGNPVTFVDVRCPYGQPGDRLWVRETWKVDMNHRFYRADGDPGGSVPWTPSIHMPRWASRITLEITDVRVERLQAVSQDDARAEGFELGPPPCTDAPIRWYRHLWDQINGDGAWDANPWVFAVSFKVVKP